MSAATETEGLDWRDRGTLWALLALIVLSILWPAPVLWLNESTVDATLVIDEEAFLGREAVQWDVVFWWLAGLVLLAIGRTDGPALSRSARLTRSIVDEAVRTIRNSEGVPGRRRTVVFLVSTGLLIVLLVLVVDPLVHERLMSVDQSELLELTSLMNRFGGGVAPVLTALFIGVVGVARGRKSLIRLFLVILAASVTSGAVAQVAKLAVARSRPELWSGATDFWSGGASFPSGHTLSLFVVGGAIALAVRSFPVRLAVIGAACAVAVTRVLTFRHWPSDVMFSALLALGFVWFFDRTLRAGEMKPLTGMPVVDPD